MTKRRRRNKNSLSPKKDTAEKMTRQFSDSSNDVDHPFLFYAAMSMVVSLMVPLVAQYGYNRYVRQQRSTVCFSEMDDFVNNASDSEIYQHDVKFLSALRRIPSAYSAGSDYSGSEYEKKMYQFVRQYCQIGGRAGYTNVLIEVGWLYSFREKIKFIECYNNTLGDLINAFGRIVQKHKRFSSRQKGEYCTSAIKQLKSLVDQVKILQLVPLGVAPVLMAASVLFLLIMLTPILLRGIHQIDWKKLMRSPVEEPSFQQQKNKKSPKNKKNHSPKKNK